MPEAVVILGVPEFARRITELAGDGQKRVVKFAARKALEPVLIDAQLDAPFQSGRLMNSVKLRPIKRSKKAGRIGYRVTTGTKESDWQGRGFYGAFLHYGWKPGRRTLGVQRAMALRRRGASIGNAIADAYLAKHDKRRQVEPRPWMAEAAKKNQDKAAAIFQREFHKKMDREIKKMNKGKG